MSEITVIGGGLAGLAAAITCAEEGAEVKLLEAHQQLGGRARSTDGSYRANLGPHAIYTGGVLSDWLTERNLMPPIARPLLTGVRFRYSGAVHRTPPLSLIPPGLRLRGRVAPVDQDFRSWVVDHADERTADFLSALAGVYTFHHDPGELSAAFVWERTQRLLLTPRPPARFVSGGWTNLVNALEQRARELRVQIITGERVDAIPDPPVIVALELRDARTLLKDDTLQWPSGHTVCLDLGLRDRGGDPWIVSDLESAGWIERYARSWTAAAGRSTYPARHGVTVRRSIAAMASSFAAIRWRPTGACPRCRLPARSKLGDAPWRWPDPGPLPTPRERTAGYQRS
jgi:hypothetical protein